MDYNITNVNSFTCSTNEEAVDDMDRPPRVSSPVEPQKVSEQPRWFENHDNVLELLRYMAQTYPVRRESMDQMAYAAEKPWKHADVWNDAQAYFKELDEEFQAR
jgi:hypothetical protein